MASEHACTFTTDFRCDGAPDCERTAREVVATLRAENDRLRGVLAEIERNGCCLDKMHRDLTHKNLDECAARVAGRAIIEREAGES